MTDRAAGESPRKRKAEPGSLATTEGGTRRTPDTYWLLEGVTLFLFEALGGLYVQGEENVPKNGTVLMVSNHVSYLDPVAIGDASPRRVVFMAKAELFRNRVLGFLLRGVDSFPVKRGEPDRAAFKNTLSMLEEGRVVCIFPQGTRREAGDLADAEPGAGLFAIRTGCPVVPVYVSGTDRMLDRQGKWHRGRVTVAFGEPFTLARETDREEGGRRMMREIAATRDRFASAPARRIRPHWIRKPREGARAVR
ncbi:MAG: lysophospholipid acyltransferase family protein [Capsulimonadales bacterium]|nr:lysophospholipid acyltransferase family protein [Capsulimonadales bacterium]